MLLTLLLVIHAALVNGHPSFDILSQVKKLPWHEVEKALTIFPGTKWCGKGNTATSEDDLGIFNNTDSCCREHDHCPDVILSGEFKHGLINSGLFTKSHCDCDQRLYQCLKKVGGAVAIDIGLIYFTFAKPRCFKEDNFMMCAKTGGQIPHCMEYVKVDDSSTVKGYQWFDNPDF